MKTGCRILVTNDDGIFSPGLRALVDFASTLGSVTVVAPKTEQSGKSHSIDIHNKFEIMKVDYKDAAEAYSVDSTPSDCVRFAFDRLGSFDYIFSGVNKGVNVGYDIAYSGTCGAVFEGCFFNTVSVAFSTIPTTLEFFSANIERVWSYLIENRLFEKNLLWNINFPSNPKGIKITQQGGPYYKDNFKTDDGKMYYEVGYSVYEPSSASLSYDTDAVLRDSYISITPLSGKRTEMDVFNALKEI